jgi:choice-of-anchor A domain-containing protein
MARCQCACKISVRIVSKIRRLNESASPKVGGDLIFPSGRVYRGDILVAGSTAQVGSAVINGLAPNQQLIANATLPIDFAAERTRLLAESARLAKLAGNTTYEYQYGGLYLHGDGSSALQIFNLNGEQVLDAHTFQVDGIPAGASVLFNISGKRSGLDNMSMSSLIPYRNKVLYNFYQATDLVLAGISVEGSILAPLAVVNNPQGVIQGTIVAKSWSGPMQINLVGYQGCTTNPDGTPTVCASTPSTPVAIWNHDLFSANASLERLEVRGGKPGAADWEFGLGSNTQTAGLFVQAEHTWVSGVAYRYVLSYSGTGGGNIKLYNGATLLFDKTYTGTAPLRVGDALQLYVKSSAGIGNAVVAVTADKVNGLTTSGAIATRGDNAFNELRLNYFYPPMKSSFVIEGTVKLTFTGTIPTGSRLNFMINSGNLICNGGAL